MYKFIDLEYDSQGLLEIFSKLGDGGINSHHLEKTAIKSLFRQCPGIAFNHHNIDIVGIDRWIKPYISPRNNGLIIFPLDGTIKLNFYSWAATRETLSPMKRLHPRVYQEIEQTLIESIEVDRPVIFNGLVPHSYGPVGNTATVAAIKIPLELDWSSIFPDS